MPVNTIILNTDSSDQQAETRNQRAKQRLKNQPTNRSATFECSPSLYAVYISGISRKVSLRTQYQLATGVQEVHSTMSSRFRAGMAGPVRTPSKELWSTTIVSFIGTDRYFLVTLSTGRIVPFITTRSAVGRLKHALPDHKHMHD